MQSVPRRSTPDQAAGQRNALRLAARLRQLRRVVRPSTGIGGWLHPAIVCYLTSPAGCAARLAAIDKAPLSGCYAAGLSPSAHVAAVAARACAGFAACVRFRAVVASAICEKACGKLPSWRRATGSYYSASSPTSLRRAKRRSNRRPASSCRPSRIRLSANQKLHARNAPSPAGSPSATSSVS